MQNRLDIPRLSANDALDLWHNYPLGELGQMATELKEKISGKTVYYNCNIHLEPSNICAFDCTFCSYRRAVGQDGAWSHSLSEIEEICKSHTSKTITEVHIVGGVDPRCDFEYYKKLLEIVHKILPNATLKTYTAVELHHIINRAGLTIEQGLQTLKDAGMQAIAGGGAEIFAPRVRQQICPDKCTAQQWLDLHKTAHQLGLSTNCTMLYGHIETIEERIDHLIQLRDLQDQTGGFSAFIPLKFKTQNNPLGKNITETSTPEDLRMMALSRLVLDNIPHIKAYWPMLGIPTTEMALSFGASDIDGTINDTTKIYSMAGAQDQKPTLTVAQCQQIIKNAGYNPTERDTFYNEIKR